MSEDSAYIMVNYHPVSSLNPFDRNSETLLPSVAASFEESTGIEISIIYFFIIK